MNQAQKLDKAFVHAERLASLIFVGIVAMAFLLVWALVGFVFRGTFDLAQWMLLLGWFAFTMLGVFCSVYFPKRTYETTSWELKAGGIEIKRGIWWQHQIFIPRDRIQHTDIKQGPIMRSFGIATLVINTGGTHEPSIPLAGILPETAEAIRDQLSTKDSMKRAAVSINLPVIVSESPVLTSSDSQTNSIDIPQTPSTVIKVTNDEVGVVS